MTQVLLIFGLLIFIVVGYSADVEGQGQKQMKFNFANKEYLITFEGGSFFSGTKLPGGKVTKKQQLAKKTKGPNNGPYVKGGSKNTKLERVVSIRFIQKLNSLLGNSPVKLDGNNISLTGTNDDFLSPYSVPQMIRNEINLDQNGNKERKDYENTVTPEIISQEIQNQPLYTETRKGEDNDSQLQSSIEQFFNQEFFEAE